MFKPKAKWSTPASAATSSAGFWRDTPPPSKSTLSQRSTHAQSSLGRGTKESGGQPGNRKFRLPRPSPGVLFGLMFVSMGAGVLMLGAKGCFTHNAHTCWLRGERALFALRDWRARHGESTEDSADTGRGAPRKRTKQASDLEQTPNGNILDASTRGRTQATSSAGGASSAGGEHTAFTAEGGEPPPASLRKPAQGDLSSPEGEYNETELFVRALGTKPIPVSTPDLSVHQLEQALASKGATGARGYAKIAFLFLTRGPLPLAKMWVRFLETAKEMMPQGTPEVEEELFSIYIHTAKAFRYVPGDVPEVFASRRIPSEDIKWGGISMIDAERRLLAQALLDPLNQRFVLVSDSCIPLFNFTFIYNYLMNTEVNFVRGSNYRGAAGTGRWNRGFLPLVPVEQWRKGNQWFAITREAAQLIVGDDLYYPAFREHCRSCSHARCNPPSCYSDEHYVQTFLYNIMDNRKLENRSVTWIDWSRGGPHPMSFAAWEVGDKSLAKVRAKPHCSWNGVEPAWCYLFARKFQKDTIHALLKWSNFLGY